MNDDFESALDTAVPNTGGLTCATCAIPEDHEISKYIAMWLERTRAGTTKMSQADLHKWCVKAGYTLKKTALHRHIRECLRYDSEG